MNVVGHGIDLVDIAEMRRWIEDPRDPLVPRCFVQAELNEIGTGFGAGVAFTDVMIHRAPGAAPEVRLSGGAAKAATALGVTDWRLSISHAGGMAMASVLALSA